MREKPLVFVASPFKAPYIEGHYSGDVQDENEIYARHCCLDALDRGEIPFAPHLHFPQFLKDDIEDEREIGFLGGIIVLRRACQKLAVYIDLGLSEGMKAERDLSLSLGIPIAVRAIGRSRVLEAGVKTLDKREINTSGILAEFPQFEPEPRKIPPVDHGLPLSPKDL